MSEQMLKWIVEDVEKAQREVCRAHSALGAVEKLAQFGEEYQRNYRAARVNFDVAANKLRRLAEDFEFFKEKYEPRS